MSREADYTIQGFIYQFNITLLRLLNDSSNSTITVEGIVEDIDIVNPALVQAIQCKYHETKTKFNLSSIYKPVLQMMCNYNKNTSKKIKYILHAHFPGEKVGSKRKLTIIEINEILNTDAKNLQKLVSEVKGKIDINKFIRNFEIEFGSSLTDTEKAVTYALSQEGFTTEDVEEMFYPNAINKIASISIIHDVNKRKIQKSTFIQELKKIKIAAVSRWTKELNSYEKILKKRREQLKDKLNQNHRVRYLLINSNYLNKFEEKIVSFIQDFIEKYNSKIRLHHTPLICLDCEQVLFDSIQNRLHESNVSIMNGYIVNTFYIDLFLKEPVKAVKENKTEFLVRICRFNDLFQEILARKKFDDLFIVTKKDYNLTGIKDLCVQKLEVSEFNELEYLLAIKPNIE